MAEKTEFRAEFTMNISQRRLYPYISSPSGLSQWMADDVTVDEYKVFNFIWNKEEHKAKIVSYRLDSYVRFEFLSDPDDEDPPFIEIRIEISEITQMVFLAIIDYSILDNEESMALWEKIVKKLKGVVGG